MHERREQDGDGGERNERQQCEWNDVRVQRHVYSWEVSGGGVGAGDVVLGERIQRGLADHGIFGEQRERGGRQFGAWGGDGLPVDGGVAAKRIGDVRG